MTGRNNEYGHMSLSRLKLGKKSFYFHPNFDDMIASKSCMQHDSRPMLVCIKCFINLMTMNRTGAKQFCDRILLLTKTFGNWARGTIFLPQTTTLKNARRVHSRPVLTRSVYSKYSQNTPYSTHKYDMSAVLSKFTIKCILNLHFPQSIINHSITYRPQKID